MNWVETTQISDLELLSLAAEENPKWGVLQPDNKVIVYHGTSLSRVSEFINGFDATRVVYRHYGGPKHAGVFVTPDVDVAARFADYGKIVLELRVRAKNLHGVDYSGNIGRKQDMQAWVKDGLKKTYPRSFRPHLSDTMSQSVEPQGLLLGLVRPSQILRVRYKKHGQEPVWYSRQEFLALGLTTTGTQPYGQAKPVRDVAWDLSSPRYSFDEYLALVAGLLDVSEERARASVQRMLAYGREEQLRDMLNNYHMGPKAIDAFVRKAKRALSAQENPKRQVFTPSYPANTLEEYRHKVAEGDKPDLHTMVDGGRTTVRYGETPEHQTTKTKRTRQARWEDQTTPWNARTQSLAVHEVSHMPPNMRTPDTGSTLATEGAELEVARAIQRYRDQSKDGALGLVVPDTVWPLIRAGMPRPEATILVDRARRAFYPDVPSEGVRELAQRYRFFHWELEFVDVFEERGGFDLVLGNPPWIKLGWEEKAILSDYQPRFEIRSQDGKLVTGSDTLQAMTQALKGLRKAKRWRGIKVTGGLDGIGIERESPGQNMWLYDLWLIERLLEEEIDKRA